MPVTGTQPTTLRALVRSVTRQLAEGNFAVTDMSRAGSLEHDPTLQGDLPPGELGYGEIRRLEGPIRAVPVERHAGRSPIRYFLDGSQRTLPVWRVGMVPIIASVSAAAILSRPSPDDVGLVPGTLWAQISWVVPRYTTNPTLNRMVELLEMAGGLIIDPLEAVHQEDPEAYHHQVGFYTHMLERSYEAAKTHRERLEGHLLRHWRDEILPEDPGGWIVADGRLRTDIPNAIGLVKDVQAQHLYGDEAEALYDLPVGCRTTAYTLVSDGSREQWDRAMWYLRMQSPTGQDARHGLIRLETPAIAAEIDLVEPISSWILAERAPRASADARWATLLYPIHLLERMLKRRIQSLTAGWPA